MGGMIGEDLDGKLSAGKFKQVISKKWRRRKGNEESEVLAFVKGL